MKRVTVTISIAATSASSMEEHEVTRTMHVRLGQDRTLMPDTTTKTFETRESMVAFFTERAEQFWDLLPDSEGGR